MKASLLTLSVMVLILAASCRQSETVPTLDSTTPAIEALKDSTGSVEKQYQLHRSVISPASDISVEVVSNEKKWVRLGSDSIVPEVEFRLGYPETILLRGSLRVRLNRGGRIQEVLEYCQDFDFQKYECRKKDRAILRTRHVKAGIPFRVVERTVVQLGSIEILRPADLDDLATAETYLSVYLGETIQERIEAIQRRFERGVIYEPYVGIGVELGIKDNILLVTRVFKDSPAARAGIMLGDQILTIKPQPEDPTWSTDGLGVEEAVRLFRGPEGIAVTLHIQRNGWAEPKEFTIKRARIAS